MSLWLLIRLKNYVFLETFGVFQGLSDGKKKWRKVSYFSRFSAMGQTHYFLELTTILTMLSEPPLVRWLGCTRWVPGSCWSHPQMAAADWTTLAWVQVGSPRGAAKSANRGCKEWNETGQIVISKMITVISSFPWTGDNAITHSMQKKL